MNLAQRRHAAEAATQSIPVGTGGHWISGTSLTIGQVRFPRGSRVPDEVVAAIEPGRLAVLMSNRLLMHRLGPAPANAPAAVPVIQDDAAATRAAQRAAMLRNGWEPWELDRNIPAPPGAYARQAHPSEMAKPSRWPLSQARGLIDE